MIVRARRMSTCAARMSSWGGIPSPGAGGPYCWGLVEVHLYSRHGERVRLWRTSAAISYYMSPNELRLPQPRETRGFAMTLLGFINAPLAVGSVRCQDHRDPDLHGQAVFLALRARLTERLRVFGELLLQNLPRSLQGQAAVGDVVLFFKGHL